MSNKISLTIRSETKGIVSQYGFPPSAAIFGTEPRHQRISTTVGAKGLSMGQFLKSKPLLKSYKNTWFTKNPQ